MPWVYSPQGAVTDEFCHLAGCEEGRSKDGVRWRHWPIAEMGIQAAKVICVHLNRNKFYFHNMLKKETIQLQCKG